MIKTRIAIEKAIANATVDALLAAGYRLGIENGDSLLAPCADPVTIKKYMMQTDDEYLTVYPNTQSISEGKRVGWVRFVYGNDGYDVISDYTVNLEAVLSPAQQLADRIESGDFEIR